MPFIPLEVIILFYYWYFLKDLEPCRCFVLKMVSSVCNSDACVAFIGPNSSAASRLYCYIMKFWQWDFQSWIQKECIHAYQTTEVYKKEREVVLWEV